MEKDPMAVFGSLMSVCIRDDWKKESMLTATAVSFALGMVASVVSVYLLSIANVLV
jgi:hypothetical protein